MPKRRVRRHEVVQPLDESYRLIPLTQGQNAIVDIADYEWLDQWNWHAKQFPNGLFYAARCVGKNQSIRMHAALFGGKCDHVNRNGLDNRRKNLRKATRAQQCQNRSRFKNNSSGYVGVVWMKKMQRWQARIHVNGKRIYVGHFRSKEEAAKSRNKAAIKYYGPFAVVDF